MSAVNPVRLAVLCVLLAAAAFVVHRNPVQGAQRTPKPPLRQVFAAIPGWRFAGVAPMDPRVVEELKLDDYLFQGYGRERGVVTLYVGYYKSAKKVGAAHDPLVCFQGQGWKIAHRENGAHLAAGDPALRISYSSMVAERQGARQLIVYWFQSNETANASTGVQKAALVMDRLSGRGGENAFVRITAPLDQEPPEEVRRRVFQFIDDFYPGFYRYLTRT